MLVFNAYTCYLSLRIGELNVGMFPTTSTIDKASDKDISMPKDKPTVSNEGHNPFEKDGFTVPSTTHKCCCVAVRRANGDVDVRDTKNPDSPTLTFSYEEWRTFLTGVRNNEFDV